VIRIQAAARGLIARRWSEVRRCRMDLRWALGEARSDPNPDAPHPEVLACMVDLGEAYTRAWDSVSAMRAFACALSSIEREYGVGDVRLRRPAEALGQLLAAKGNFTDAQRVLKRALSAPKPALADDGFGDWQGAPLSENRLGPWLAGADVGVDAL
jgi:hypothetical protein